ncbi:ubiquinone anaerobic biosynthesis protein UbiV [Rhodopseudomonas pseudopalustris]|uniref:Ubiquinone biosynthesis protein UbiV n=1 Tax=Rhodopseudomonas pseudopalustris TaxID=1513892 RepID=A0A1H8LZK2_9BRAD|nr:U32 family peptidase [Rhodopseudomonas pseudopalustris]SEO10306.1 Collagenase-like protease, PrtC family [Rhodopseudomonas pseudopalustris]
MQLTLGPVLYNWKPELWRDFYFRIADEAPVDTVVVGEVVCSKRSPFLDPHIPAVVERLAAAGKTVLMGSLTLMSLPRERKAMLELAADDTFTMEVNDLTCLGMLGGKPHAIGPFVNIYNEATATYFASRGATRICLPPELPLSAIRAIAQAQPDVTFEVFSFGRVPLAISARCYHARLNKLSKDNCKFVCDQDPDGLAVTTLDDEPFLAMNGVQTLSYTSASLLGDVDKLRDAGVGAMRLSPQQCDMVAVAKLFRDVVDGKVAGNEGTEKLSAIYPLKQSNGFLYAKPGSAFVTDNGDVRRIVPAA